MGLSNELSCEAGSFSCCCLNPPRVFSIRGLSFYLLCWSPGLCGLLHSPAVPSGFCMHECGAAGSSSCCTARPIHSTIRCLSGSTSRCIAASSVCPGCPSPPLLLVWMNVSSLTPWLLDFCAVRFSVSSGCFLFFNCCYPSFGCARRCSVSTYTSILVLPLSLYS